MPKQIVKRTKNGETQYFGTHSDAVQVGEGQNSGPLTAWMGNVETGLSQRYTKTEVDAKISTVYKPGGACVSVAALPSPSASYEGFVYDMTAEFTTTSDFKDYALQGAKTFPAGTQVAVVNVGTSQNPSYKYDTLSGFVDLSGYIRFNSAQSLTNAQQQQARSNISATTAIETIELLRSALSQLPYRSVIADGVIPPKAFGSFAADKKEYTNGFVTISLREGLYNLDQAAVYGNSFVVAVSAVSSENINDGMEITPAFGFLIKRVILHAKSYSNAYPFYIRMDGDESVKTINATGDYISKTYEGGTSSATLFVSSGTAGDTNNKWLCFNGFVVELVPAPAPT